MADSFSRLSLVLSQVSSQTVSLSSKKCDHVHLLIKNRSNRTLEPAFLLTVPLVVLAQHLRKVEGVGEDAAPVEDGPGEPLHVAPLGSYSVVS